MIKNLLCLALIAAALCAFAGNSYAQSGPYAWTPDQEQALPGGLVVQGIGTESAYFDSNPLLLTTKTESLWGSITSPELVVNDATPTSTLMSDTVFSSNNFNESEFSSNDVHSKLNAIKQMQQWGIGFLGNIDYDTTRTSELSDYNNIKSIPVRHTGGTVTPDITYNFLPTDKLTMQGSYSTNTYANSAFTDYQTYSFNPTYSHDFDQLNTGVISFQAQRYQATKGSLDINDSLGPSIGWQTRFTPQLSGDANVGIQESRVKTEFLNAPWITQYTFAADLKYKTIQDALLASASRSEYPFGNGTEAYLTQISLQDTHQINDLFSIGAAGSYQTANYQANSAGNLSSLASGSLNLTYHATQQFDLTGSYQYQMEDLVGVSTSATSHTALFSLVYRPQAWTL